MIKFLSIICLSYLYWAHGPYYNNLAYPKEYVFALRLICIIYIIWYHFLEPFIMFFVICDYMIMTCDRYVTVCDAILNLNSKSKK